MRLYCTELRLVLLICAVILVYSHLTRHCIHHPFSYLCEEVCLSSSSKILVVYTIEQQLTRK